jgi:integrase
VPLKENKLIGERTARDYASIYDNHIKAKFEKMRLCDISRDVIFSHCATMLQNSSVGPEAIRKLLIIMTQVLERAVDEKIIADNPASTLKPAKFKAQQSAPRERFLDSAELRMLWQALDKAVDTNQISLTDNGLPLAGSVILSYSVVNCMRLIMVTGVRRGEAAQMQWAQIDGDRWTIPKTKNGKAHVVTLCPLAQNIIEQQRRIAGCSWVFESVSKPGFAIHSDSVTRALERLRSRYLAELVPFTVHDLRRSVATGCGLVLGASVVDVEGLLNHQISDRLLKTYQSAALRDPGRIRRLFLSWGEHVAKNIAGVDCGGGNNVIQVSFGKRG